ncbi:phosphatidylserine decarboxylase [Trichodelitschia bisporula]|uniref:Phosphatidylserine decarboxylase proenzyme 1, mitochondrial n=1 Tax=Trichodelitschia bisporula TaxID=703511 RepID=A0A6G1HJ61_9PEZI|nr:phosphatidylserine decarboxylase [Trichodelitschia bisporula]
MNRPILHKPLAPIGLPLPRPRRIFTTTRPQQAQQQQHHSDPFRTRLRTALNRTRIQWYTIPVGVGIAFLGSVQFYRVNAREKALREEGEVEDARRGRHRLSGPWQVQIMSTLPLKALSRLWGRFNELTIPYYLRVPGFKLYSYIFGVNLSEVAEADLHTYPNLASFFYRTLKPGSRPLDPNPNAVLSPADGRVIQFGTIEAGEIEQVKGVTYSLSALLGSRAPTPPSTPTHSRSPSPEPANPDVVAADEEFARVNGISYSLPNLLTGDGKKASPPASDQSIPSSLTSEVEVSADLARPTSPWWAPAASTKTTLYYAVVYLAPGDYHRFHSPVAWVVQSRRHFAGELFSVSPWLQRTLPGLFTLNERVVLLGRWRWGFFSYTPVGATNVGSIVLNFDRELRTNSLLTDTAADKAAAEARERGEAYAGFSEAQYASASEVLGGNALRRGEEMGGFRLGSTIVLVFEAPKDGWKWEVKRGERVKVGQALGEVVEE